mmetsp:Transcript_126405/g.316014  ORF Transcript_126405/g.316014 Transcript_126405/m.316014 type:complete len:231 (-) Transcript_126405:1646-2338(-)
MNSAYARESGGRQPRAERPSQFQPLRGWCPLRPLLPLLSGLLLPRSPARHGRCSLCQQLRGSQALFLLLDCAPCGFLPLGLLVLLGKGLLSLPETSQRHLAFLHSRLKSLLPPCLFGPAHGGSLLVRQLCLFPLVPPRSPQFLGGLQCRLRHHQRNCFLHLDGRHLGQVLAAGREHRRSRCEVRIGEQIEFEHELGEECLGLCLLLVILLLALSLVAEHLGLVLLGVDVA